MQIFPDLYETNSLPIAKVGVERPINQAAPFANILNNIAERATQLTHIQSQQQQQPKAQPQAQASQQAPSAATTPQARPTHGATQSNTQQREESTGSELKLTQEDLTRLKARLQQQGMSQEDIAEIEHKVESGEGMTWKQFVDHVAKKFGFSTEDLPAEFGVEQKKAINTFFDKLGFTPQESAEMIADLSQSKGPKVIMAISEKLAKIEPGDDPGISSTELAALAAAMHLPQSAIKKLNGSLGVVEERTLPKQAVVAGLSTIMSESAKTKEGLGRKLEDLKTVLVAGMQDAIKRTEQQKLANNKGSKDTRNAKVLIEEAANKNFAKSANEQVASARSPEEQKIGKAQVQRQVGQANNERTPASGEDMNAVPKANVAPKANAVPKANAAPANAAPSNAAKTAETSGEAQSKATNATVTTSRAPKAKAAKTAETSGAIETKAAEAIKGGEAMAVDPEQHTEGGEAPTSETNGKPEQFLAQALSKENSAGHKQQYESGAFAGNHGANQAFDPLKAKIEFKVNAADELAGFQGLSGKSGETSVAAGKEAVGQAKQTVDADRLYKTVQNGVLSNLSQGRTQLSLQLDPEGLGKLTVILQIKNKEITAVIKTENDDVTKALSENMGMLRQSLEEQGLKVEKLDVQTQLSQDSQHRNWQGAEQHNQTQEQELRNKMLSSWRFLRDRGDSSDALAHEMQSTVQQVKVSQQGLDLIA